jgi:hypothetical protein
MQATLPLCSGKQGSPQWQLVGYPPAAVAVEGRPRLHRTTKLPIPAVNTIHAFSAQSKLCFVRDWLSGKDFLVDTGATLSLLPHQSAAAATGPKLQSMKGQPIKTLNFVNTRVEFNGWERKFAFLRADVPFPIIVALRKAAPMAAAAKVPPMCVFWQRKRCQCLSRKPPPVLALFTLGLSSCWRSSLVWSGRRRRLRNPAMEWCTTLRPTVGLFLPKLGA